MEVNPICQMRFMSRKHLLMYALDKKNAKEGCVLSVTIDKNATTEKLQENS